MGEKRPKNEELRRFRTEAEVLLKIAATHAQGGVNCSHLAVIVGLVPALATKHNGERNEHLTWRTTRSVCAACGCGCDL